ncbi:unnamed protein product [Owenia fusiformis]|uniref:Uncharacterized protein n=1 Tax=Owenia fusiformis TaxID=6347 RepID=A0A8J1XY04_OWEFU|nr:unnamed protein product [Owenia fusiformis]
MYKMMKLRKKVKGQCDVGVQAVLAPGVGDFIHKMQQIINDTTYLMQDNQAMTEYLAHKIKLITDTVDSQDKQITTFNENNDTLKDKLERMILEVDVLEADADDMRKERAKLKAKIDERIQEREDAEKEISWLIEERDTSNKKVQNLTIGIEKLQNNLNVMAKEHDQYEWQLQQMLMAAERRSRKEVNCLLNTIARLRVENHTLKQKKFTAANITEMTGLLATTEAYLRLAEDKEAFQQKIVLLASEKMELKFALKRLQGKFNSLTNSIAAHEMAGCKASISQRELDKMKMVQRSLCVQVNPEDITNDEESTCKSDTELSNISRLRRDDSIGSQDSLVSVSSLGSPRRSRTKLAKVPIDCRMSGLIHNISIIRPTNDTPTDMEGVTQDNDSTILSESENDSFRDDNDVTSGPESEIPRGDMKKGKYGLPIRKVIKPILQ